MKSTIEAMKPALRVLRGGDLHREDVADRILSEAIQREEAQSVEPDDSDMNQVHEGSVESVTSVPFVQEARYIVLKGADLRGLHPHHWTQLSEVIKYHDRNRRFKGKLPLECVVVESDWPEYDPTWKAIQNRVTSEGTPPVKQPLPVEREALIKRLCKAANYLHGTPGMALLKEAADMLAADAQEIAGWSADQKENMDAMCDMQKEINDLKAQQVAVPQGWKLVPVEPTPEMITHAWRESMGLCDHEKLTRVYKATLAAAPQPPQAERVPMTAQELNDLLPTNDSMSRYDALRWVARATERKHGIGVKS